MKILILIIIAFLFPFCAHAQITDTFVQNTVFVESHDPGYFVLKDKNDKEYIADFYYDTISADDISTWKAQEPITIFLKKDVGIGIIREKTKKFYKVFFRQNNHPIETILNLCLKNAKSYFDECYMNAALRWNQEQLFILNNQKNLDYALYSAKTEKAWQAYQQNVKDEFFKSREDEDYRLKTTYQAILNARLERDRYFHLVHFLNFTNSYRDD